VVACALISLVVLPGIYVASAGLAYRIVIGRELEWVDLERLVLLDRLYAPLWWATSHWPSCDQAMHWYAGDRLILNGDVDDP
jgi:hypothetical protein